ncbi:MAG: hypothetical protein KME46_01100 [Brasilonema angustatum HA4187-MV1]|nr:hypothetical protein [Brasilonema angustatum HA4187-MV1]
MKPSIVKPQVKYTVELNWADRWQIYQRLQELDIPCWCQTNQPLTVEISNPTAAIQLWSVVQQFTICRKDSIRNLKKCWQYRS